MTRTRDLCKSVLVAMALVLAASPAWADQAAEPSADRVLRMLPEKTLFCVRVNNTDSALGSISSFLQGVAPDGFDAQALVYAKLSAALGTDPKQVLRQRGTMVLFATELPSKEPPQHPMQNLFMGMILPVRDYEALVSQNAHISEPDKNGVSTIKIKDQPGAMITDLGRYALLTQPQPPERVAQAKAMMRPRTPGLTQTLDAADAAQAAESPIWIYVNGQEAPKLLLPIIEGQMKQAQAKMQEEAKKSGKKPPVANFDKIIGFYLDFVKMVFSETDRITIGLAATGQAADATVTITAMPGSAMAEMFTASPGRPHKTLHGYLEDGAMLNIATNIDAPSMQTLYDALIDLLAGLAADSLSGDEISRLKSMTTKAIDAMGDSIAVSFGTGDEQLFKGTYVIRVDDADAFREVIDEEIEMANDGLISRLYKGFGLDLDVKIKRDRSTYKGVRVDSAMATLKMADEDSEAAMAIQKMFGEGLEYRWALVDGYCVYAFGGDSEAGIGELIDQVKAGHPRRVGDELKAAMAALPDSDRADAIGTFNIVRILNMVSAIMPLPEGAGPLTFETRGGGNIAFCARGADGKLTINVNLPKEHLVEIKEAFDKIDERVKEAKKKEKATTST